MILKDTFYTIESQTETETGWKCGLSLNASHPIYQAHFPGHPVTPGVCIVQLAKEIASVCHATSFFLCGLRNVKFLRIIDPLERQDLFVHLSAGRTDEQGQLAVPVSIKSGTTVFASMTLTLMPHGEEEAQPALQARMERLRLCVVIPTYNNSGTLVDVLRQTLRYTRSVIVVNDGATDCTASVLERFAGRIDVVSHAPNKGKGYALKRGFERARELGYEAAVTLDSDGQHDVADLEAFVRQAEIHPGCLLTGQRMTKGKMPLRNIMGNRFSNFWYTVQTGRRLSDTQNGFRLYPLTVMKHMRPFSTRYEAEVELLVRTAWKGIPVFPVPVSVYYAPESERVTHFRPGKDFFRASILNTVLTLLAVCYGYPRLLCRKLFSIKQKR
ncbi:MAG: glycosyltransferase [Tannerella sp.]|jgi:3-hydroxymyristoyl/3-hydroxydecanoyl-(acyl carrier protein) dehydratase|nr:glycosyltransferase [Tannerella sp.]